MSNKDVIAQEILCFDAVGRVSKLLDQLCSGLRELGVLNLIRTFPDLFVHLFTKLYCLLMSKCGTRIYIIYMDELASEEDIEDLTTVTFEEFI